jgi:hypothetical protein
MKKTRQYRSPVMASIHERAEGLHAGGLMNKLTMSGNVFTDIGFTRLPKHLAAQRAEQRAAPHGKQPPRRRNSDPVQPRRYRRQTRSIPGLRFRARKRSSVIVSNPVSTTSGKTTSGRGLARFFLGKELLSNVVDWPVMIRRPPLVRSRLRVQSSSSQTLRGLSRVDRLLPARLGRAHPLVRTTLCQRSTG